MAHPCATLSEILPIDKIGFSVRVFPKFGKPHFFSGPIGPRALTFHIHGRPVEMHVLVYVLFVWPAGPEFKMFFVFVLLFLWRPFSGFWEFVSACSSEDLNNIRLPRPPRWAARFGVCGLVVRALYTHTLIVVSVFFYSVFWGDFQNFAHTIGTSAPEFHCIWRVCAPPFFCVWAVGIAICAPRRLFLFVVLRLSPDHHVQVHVGPHTANLDINKLPLSFAAVRSLCSRSFWRRTSTVLCSQVSKHTGTFIASHWWRLSESSQAVLHLQTLVIVCPNKSSLLPHPPPPL